MLPVIIGGIIGVAITAVIMSEDKKCDETSEKVTKIEETGEEGLSSETIDGLRQSIEGSLAKLKSIT